MKLIKVENINVSIPENSELRETLFVDGLYVRLNFDDMDTFDRRSNIWKFDLNGNLLWKIAPTTTADMNVSYKSLELIEGEIIAYNPIGADVIVDKETGKTSLRFKKERPW